MEWNRALRYKKFDDWSEQEKIDILDRVQQSPWRMDVHIQPKSGLLNDPNGFSYYNDQWHLFYQNYPMGPVHGLKAWYHLTSSDLTHWKENGLAMIPDTQYDSHGCYSGSALPVDDKLFIMYTGNVRDKEWQRYPYQIGAWMDKTNKIKKIKSPLIARQPDHYTDHFRDPQVIRQNNQYYVLLGAQNDKLNGEIVVYQSDDLSKWTFLGTLTFADQSLGYMIECPNLIFIDETPVLIFCPQGLDKNILDYKNIYPNVFLVGDQIDLDVPVFESKHSLHNLDEGFDCYATQAFNAPDGRALAVSWVGLPEIDYPTDHYGWAHCLSFIKELSIKDGRLYQNPVRETKALRAEHNQSQGTIHQQSQVIVKDCSPAYELDIDLSGEGSCRLALADNGTQSLDLNIDFQAGVLTLDRGHSGASFGEAYGTGRSTTIPKTKPVHLQIFIDHSIAEIFVNHGFKVLTTRFFPGDDQTQITLETASRLDYNYNYWRLTNGKG
ncbi:MAG: sucrose-6-phosphate hydrolase [Sporolactobacillus sp.]